VQRPITAGTHDPPILMRINMWAPRLLPSSAATWQSRHRGRIQTRKRAHIERVSIMLRKIILASLLAGAASPALAQSSGFDWSGFYAGINAGYGGNKFSYPVTGDLTLGAVSETLEAKAKLNSSGFLGGGQVGFNLTNSGAWLFGIEADIDASSITGEVSANGAAAGLLAANASIKAGSEIDYLGTVRGRAGFITSRDLLICGTAGLAYGEVKSRYALGVSSAGTSLFAAAGSQSDTDMGWTVGLGAEYPVSDRMTLKAEYLYADLGEHTLIATPFALLGATGDVAVKVGTTANIVRVGLNYALD
jgi:outer membrane immunogenic protein